MWPRWQCNRVYSSDLVSPPLMLLLGMVLVVVVGVDVAVTCRAVKALTLGYIGHPGHYT